MKRTWLLLGILSGIASALAAGGVVSAGDASRDLALSLPSASRSHALPSGLDSAAVRRAIEQANGRWVEAFRRGDAPALATFYTDSANVFPPTRQILEGPGPISDWFVGQRKAGMGEPTLETLEVVVDGDVAYEVGSYGFRFDDGSGASWSDTGRYFAIWKAHADGTWRCQVGTWTSSRDSRALALGR